MVDYIEKIQFQGQTLPIGGKAVNGAWVQKVVALVSNANLPANTNLTYSLDNYLPNDGCDYELYFMVAANTGTAVNNSFDLQCYAGSGTYPVVQMLYTVTRVANTNEHSTKSGILPIFSTDRNITFRNTANNATGFYCYLKGYRRIGKNDMTGDYISNIPYQNNNLLIGGENFDSKWSIANTQICSNISVAANGYQQFSLSDVIPNDGHDYLLLLCGWGDTSATNGQSARVKILNGSYANYNQGSKTVTDFYVWGNINRTAAPKSLGGCVIVPIRANDRNICVNNTGNGTATATMHLRGYRKLGLNNDNNPSIDTIKLSNKELHIAGPQFDGGKWVPTNVTVATWNSLVSGTTYSSDLSAHIPNDGYDYEILLDGYIWSTATDGQGAECYVRTSLVNNIMMLRCRARSSSKADRGTIILPLPSNNKVLYFLNSIGQTTASGALVLRGYRRLGTNE